MKVKTHIPEPEDRRWKSWRKLLTSVDTSQTNGYAFQGEWLRDGRMAELEVGCFMLQYDETGSARHHSPDVYLRQLQPDATWKTVEDQAGEISAEGWDWALELRDRIASVVNATAAPNSFAGYSDEELITELVRRGYRVETTQAAPCATCASADYCADLGGRADCPAL